MIAVRHCSKPGCSRTAVATLTYDYRDSTVVIGPLATAAEPNAYDMCDEHAQTLTAPKGWQVVRLVTNFEPAPPSGDDLLALVDAVRRAAETSTSSAGPAATERDSSVIDPFASTRTRRSEPTPIEYGPFSSRTGASDREAVSTGNPDTSSPLDPSSPYAQRRARFSVVPGLETEQNHGSDNQ